MDNDGVDQSCCIISLPNHPVHVSRTLTFSFRRESKISRRGLPDTQTGSRIVSLRPRTILLVFLVLLLLLLTSRCCVRVYPVLCPTIRNWWHPLPDLSCSG
ncbi:hypothetical protein LZ31DRAFT_218335 [Colletotrichum somersetense]|nr:hypothetical protein LZ31DRAFT_218335 [Colletotrichum somersetense]